MLAAQGAMVHGFDHNPEMIDFARQRCEAQNLENNISLQNMSVHAMDGLPADEYDGVVATLVFSELSDDERQFALKHAKRALKSHGMIVIADEAVPRKTLQKISHLLFRIPMLLATYLITRTATRPLQNPKAELTAAGFTVEKETRIHGDAFTIVTARLRSQDKK